MLGAILLRREQPLDVALGRLGRAGDGAEAGAAVLAGDEPLGRRADERDPVELEQEEVRRRDSRAAARGRCRAARPTWVARLAGTGRTGRRRLRRCAPSRSPPSRRSARDPVNGGSAPPCRAARGARRSRLRGVLRSPRDRPRAPPRHRRRGRSGRASRRRSSRLSGKPRPSAGNGTVGSRRATWSYARYPTIGKPELRRLVELDDPRARAHPRVAPEPSALDRFEDEAGGAGVTKAQVGAEWSEEVGVDRRRHDRSSSSSDIRVRKRPPRRPWSASRVVVARQRTLPHRLLAPPAEISCRRHVPTVPARRVPRQAPTPRAGRRRREPTASGRGWKGSRRPSRRRPQAGGGSPRGS